MRKIRCGMMMIMYGANSGRHGASSGRLHSEEKKKEIKATKIVALIPKPRAVT